MKNVLQDFLIAVAITLAFFAFPYVEAGIYIIVKAVLG